MDAIHSLEVVVNLWLQSLGAWLIVLARGFTFLGSEDFFFLIMPALYWCLDAGLGVRVALILTLSNGLNAVLKLAFHAPRPYWVDPQVRAFASEPSFGMPSGHAQNAVAVWGWLAGLVKKKSILILSVAVIGLIGLSRLALGVHYFSDVLGGWLVGGVLLWVFQKVDSPVSDWISRLSFGRLMGVCVGGTVLLMGLILSAHGMLKDWQVPFSWASRAVLAGAEMPAPRSLEGVFTLGGTFLGFTCGAGWVFRRMGGFHPHQNWERRVLGYFLGVTGVVIFWYGLGLVFPRQADILSYGLRFLRYTLVGGWVSAGTPWFLKRLRLVQ